MKKAFIKKRSYLISFLVLLLIGGTYFISKKYTIDSTTIGEKVLNSDFYGNQKIYNIISINTGVLEDRILNLSLRKENSTPALLTFQKTINELGGIKNYFGNNVKKTYRVILPNSDYQIDNKVVDSIVFATYETDDKGLGPLSLIIADIGGNDTLISFYIKGVKLNLLQELLLKKLTSYNDYKKGEISLAKEFYQKYTYNYYINKNDENFIKEYNAFTQNPIKFTTSLQNIFISDIDDVYITGANMTGTLLKGDYISNDGRGYTFEISYTDKILDSSGEVLFFDTIIKTNNGYIDYILN